MTEPTPRWLALFPLSIALFPQELLPLHVFEPRYRALVRRCQEQSVPFGIVLVREDKLAQVGCEAAILRILQQHPDGQLDILVQGGRRIALQDLREHPDGYLEGRVDTVEDEAEEDDPETRDALLALFEEYRKAVHEAEEPSAVPVDEGSDAPAMREGAGYTFRVGAQVRMSMEDCQRFLETISERRREAILLRHLAQTLPTVRNQSRHRTRVRGNGKLAPS
jgi:Lon protease-like protein